MRTSTVTSCAGCIAVAPRVEGRILLTHDRDTMPSFAYDRMRAGQPMPGIFLVGDLMPVGQAINEILLAVDCLPPEECKNFVRFFPL